MKGTGMGRGNEQWCSKSCIYGSSLIHDLLNGSTPGIWYKLHFENILEHSNSIPKISGVLISA